MKKLKQIGCDAQNKKTLFERLIKIFDVTADDEEFVRNSRASAKAAPRRARVGNPGQELSSRGKNVCFDGREAVFYEKIEKDVLQERLELLAAEEQMVTSGHDGAADDGEVVDEDQNLAQFKERLTAGLEAEMNRRRS